MFTLPTLPGWDGLHPIIVHFPIALLVVAPLLIVLGMFWKQRSAGLAISACLVVLVGTASMLLATATGDAAGEGTEKFAAARATLERHEELAETARNIFIVLAVVLSVWTLIAVRSAAIIPRRVCLVTTTVYLALHAAGSLVLLNAAHEGGRLVHEFGVRAEMTAGAIAPSPETAPAPGHRGEHDNDD